jgi:hypothetical protein
VSVFLRMITPLNSFCPYHRWVYRLKLVLG